MRWAFAIAKKLSEISASEADRANAFSLSRLLPEKFGLLDHRVTYVHRAILKGEPNAWPEK